MVRQTSTPHEPKPHAGFRLFVPILAGATWRERMIACLGAAVCIALTGAISGIAFHGDPFLPLIVAPMGASAVLLFAVPASPLAQPWPIIGGNTIAAFVGLAVSHWVASPVLAIGLSVSLAIGVLSLTRCLHPPGGAVALGMALAVPAGFGLPMFTVALNSVLLVGLGLCFHRLSRRDYPHRPTPAVANPHETADLTPTQRIGVTAQDVDAALASLGETYDIAPDDLDRLMQQVELQTMLRLHGTLTCGDIQSRDVVKAILGDSSQHARELLLRHNIRTLPVTDASGSLVGTVGLRELAAAGQLIDESVTDAATAASTDPAMSLVPMLTDGKTHAVIIVDVARHVTGIVTQTDLLAALARLLMWRAEAV